MRRLWKRLDRAVGDSIADACDYILMRVHWVSKDSFNCRRCGSNWPCRTWMDAEADRQDRLP